MCILNAEVGSNFEQQKCGSNSDSFFVQFFFYFIFSFVPLHENNAIRSQYMM